ncbi:MAG: hypothetical protein E6Q95_05320 [Chitinophagaceae bacterium]|nr:MAG: hypothetical protein E6Q95_05320 [Chitinophagaceae bacterium]
MSLRIIFTALPNGINKENGNLKISIAVSLQISDAQNGATLAQFPDVLQWPAILNKAKFLINDIEAKKTSHSMDEKLWAELFTKKVKVQSFTQPDLSKKPIYSYPVKHIIDYLDKAAQAVGKKYFNDMPDADFYTEDKLFQSISNYTVLNEIPRKGRKKNGLDDIARFKNKGDFIRRNYEKANFIPFSNQAKPELDFAQICHFHGMYHAKPAASISNISKPDFEFHDIVSVITQYSVLQRKLGLVIDVEIPNTNSMGHILACPSNLNFTNSTELVLPTTATTLTATGFYTQAEPDSIYDKGYVKINSDQFTVFQIDTDGGALKLTAHIDALQLKKAKHFLYASENNIANNKLIPALNNELQARREGLPSPRTTGIAIAKNGLAQYLSSRFERMNQLKKSTSTLTPPNGVMNSNVQYKTLASALYADDVTSGYRLDVKMGLQSDWLSVHFANNIYQYKNNQGAQIPIPIHTTEEGYIQMTTTEDKQITDSHMKLSEVLVRWEGWSLAAPPAGKGINDPMLSSKEMEDNDAAEKKKFDTPETQSFQLNVQPTVAKGTLPKLRFGNAYAIKLRAVDLAGNSVSHLHAPEYSSQAIVTGIRYLRYEPTEVPFLYYGNKVKDGESSEVMVIRSNENETTAEYESKWPTAYKNLSIRHVLPPRVAVGTAVTHGMMDAVMGIGGQKAKELYDFIITKKDKLTPTNASPKDAKVLNGDNGYGEVEYLADPLAAGLVLYLAPTDINPKVVGFDDNIFYKRVSFYDDNEVLSYNDANKEIDVANWLNPRPLRIVLQEGKNIDFKWDSSQRILSLSIPKSLQLKLCYASYWRPNDLLKKSAVLKQLGYNGFVDDASKAMAAGKHWMVSPWRVINFVHAVQQPLTQLIADGEKLPFIKAMSTSRNFGDTDAALSLQIKLHGHSTGQADIEAEWIDIEDDGMILNTKGFYTILQKAKAFQFNSVYGVHDYIFGDFPDKKIINNPFKALHQFKDTRHRWVHYKAIATTRYKENFFQLINEKKEAFPITREGNTVQKVNVLSSTRPLAPQVAYVLPTFEWDKVVKGDTIISARVSGLRVYLKRPWFSSGEGEKLAVVLMLPNLQNTLLDRNTSLYEPFVTTWGFDPTKISGNIQGYIFPIKDMFVGIKKGDANNLYIEDSLSVEEVPGGKLPIVAYDVQFDEERNMYYADIMFNIGTTYFPFVKLALAAYQQHSVRTKESDCCLSKIVLAEYIQVPPPRATSLKKEANKITVTISGTVPEFPQGADYSLLVKFLVENITVASSESVHISIQEPFESHIAIIDKNEIMNFVYTHSFQFQLPDAYKSKPYRVRVLEYEVLPTDPNRKDPYIEQTANITRVQPRGERLIFADVYEMNI